MRNVFLLRSQFWEAISRAIIDLDFVGQTLSSSSGRKRFHSREKRFDVNFCNLPTSAHSMASPSPRRIYLHSWAQISCTIYLSLSWPLNEFWSCLWALSASMFWSSGSSYMKLIPLNSDTKWPVMNHTFGSMSYDTKFLHCTLLPRCLRTPGSWTIPNAEHEQGNNGVPFGLSRLLYLENLMFLSSWVAHLRFFYLFPRGGIFYVKLSPMASNFNLVGRQCTVKLTTKYPKTVACQDVNS